MKGLVLSLKPFKQKNRNVFPKEPESYEPKNTEVSKPVQSGRGFFRDSSGNVIGRGTLTADESWDSKQRGFYTTEIPTDEKKPNRHRGKKKDYTESDLPEKDFHNYNNYSSYDNATPYVPKIRNNRDSSINGIGEMSGISGTAVPMEIYNSAIAQNICADRDNVKRHIMSVIFALTLLLGVICGSVAVSGVNMELMGNLEFLMFTDAGAEGTNGALQVFSTAFAVNFIYLTVVFLIGLSPWGVGVIPFVCLFKGFEIGLVASYLVNSFDWGMTYYFLVIAPGVFVFALSLIIQSGHSVRVSSALGKFLFTTRQDSGWIRDNIKTYMYRSGSMMVLATIAALANTFMWMICSSMFEQ